MKRRRFEGGWIGSPSGANVSPYPSYPNLTCGGTNPQSPLTGAYYMYQSPVSHPAPTIVDFHVYPQIMDVNMTGSQAQNEAKIDFDDLTRFLSIVNPSGLVMIGETHNWGDAAVVAANTGPRDNLPVYCGSYYITNPDMTHTVYTYPPSAPSATVAGFNTSSLAGYSYGVVFRPWMELEDSSGLCYPYQTYQQVNYQGGGPFTPTQ